MGIKLFDIVDLGDFLVPSYTVIETKNKLKTTNDFADFLIEEFDMDKLKYEVQYICMFNENDKVIGIAKCDDNKKEKERTFLDSGLTNFLLYSLKAKYYILAHNHPNGICKSSEEDLQSILSKEIDNQFKLKDSIIVTKNGCRSIVRDFIESEVKKCSNSNKEVVRSIYNLTFFNKKGWELE